ncbi:MAG TPA: NADP-dependent phosphogluconate dehydrogenase, partial [Candidatus Gracilibacteria bacterium]|nr:NADP-dependent phosphogluconate dehydrogenase [Candidatus Gracilibacteria bacterium]
MQKNTEPVKKGAAEVGIIGLAAMGANLARNFSGKGVKTVVYNRTANKTETFIKEFGPAAKGNLSGAKTLEELVENLAKPRVIILLVKAGDAVDEILHELSPLLTKGDIVMDMGNSPYQDTQRRSKEMDKKGLNFWGCGISGGEEGALNGPSLMPGGSKESWKTVQPLLEKVAAPDFSKKPCVTYAGPDGAGHFVKTVHNGIEYGIIQLMAEAYDLLGSLFNMPAPDVAQVFEGYSRGKLNGFLFELGAKVLKKKNDKGDGFLVDKIQDKAAQKGTGMWATQEALKLGVAIPTIAEAVFARAISADAEKRTHAEKIYSVKVKRQNLDLDKFVDMLDDALYAAIIITFNQGFDLLWEGSGKHKWNINPSEIARIWQGGCIIRMKLLKKIESDFRTKPAVPELADDLKANIPNLGKIVSLAAENGVPVAALASTHSYFLNSSRARGPMNLIQGLRDAFGAHTYERTD